MAKTAAKRRKRTTAKRGGRSAAQRGSMMPWYLLGAAVVAGVVYLDGRAVTSLWSDTTIRTASIERKAKPVGQRPVVTPAVRPVVQAVPPETTAMRVVPDVRPQALVGEKLPAFSGKWFICTTQTDYCVLDGKTILYAGRKVQLADIDAPGIADARCEAERLRGGDAKLRLREILNGGQVTLGSAGDAGGQSGATRQVVLRDGRSVGGHMVREGLARPWTGKRQSWCG